MDPRGFQEVIEVLNTVVTDEMNSDLQAPVTDAEIYRASKQLGGLKAPASGQSVNFEKSSVFFSSNTPSLLSKDICDALHVQPTDPKAKYLGLPSIYGKLKSELFSFLLEKVLLKMQGWKQKLLSQAGRETLIKSVIQAIPSYTMQCYLLPKNLLNKLMTYVRRFF
ncbi:hypothetical protein CTI12_AA577620 [Artemisia annua]|uniref:Uncharacterized protein n=1 Tax=Artemisia annua TaxID=35608 RepID=A0A2U1KQ25_ARTAN|nr:hypothetical protein CTI12_AA577620 [Artemisia annua]